MKKIIVLFLIILSFSYADNTLNSQKICAEKLEKIKDTDFNTTILPAIEEVDLRHSFSSSSSTGKTLNFLNFDTKVCTKDDGEAIEHYWSIVSLFSLNTGKILIPKKRVDEYDEETEEYSIEKPFIPTDNEKVAKNNIRKILKYYTSTGQFGDKNITINDFNIIDLDKKLVELRNSFNKDDKETLDLTLLDVNNKLLHKLNKILAESNVTKMIKDRKSPAIFLSKIAKAKKMYNNYSWFAMNFYNKEYQEAIDEYGHILETPISYVESELITNDMNDSTKKYYLLKNGKINKNMHLSKYHYFLAEDGNKNPLHEMEATLHYFFDDVEDVNKTNEKVKKYMNRYVLLKQLFKGNDTFQQASKDINSSNISTNMEFFYGYFTTGKDSSESFGHSVLLVKTKGEYHSTNMNKSLDKRFAKNNPQINITNMKEFYLNFAVDNPKEGFFSGLAYNINGMVGNINGKFKIQKQLEIDEGYKHRMLVKFPITALNNDIDKKELLSAQIEHIQDNIGNFQIPYRFMSKNCAYVFANILEVPFPDLRDKFNETGYFTFKPKDVIELLKGKIDVSKHEAIRL